MTGPVEANQEEQVGEEPRLVVEDGVSMVEDLAEKSQEMLLPSRRLRSPQVTENFVDTLSGPSNQSSSQGELSVGKVVGQSRMVRQEGMVSTKTRLAISTMVGDVGSMVAARRRIFEPNKLQEESVGSVERAEQPMEVGVSMMGDKWESSGRGAKPTKVVARKVVVAFRRNGKKVSTVCSRIEDFMENKVPSPFEGGIVKGDSNINMRGKGETSTIASKRRRGE